MTIAQALGQTQCNDENSMSRQFGPSGLKSLICNIYPFDNGIDIEIELFTVANMRDIFQPSILPSSALPHDSVVILALPLVTFTPSDFAFARISTRFLEDTACAISAAYVRLCMRRRSTSLGL